MRFTLYTIGFTQKTAEEFFGLLREAGVRKLIDVRANPGGQLSGFAKFPDIAFFLERILAIRYVHDPRLAPSPEIRDAYRKSRDWSAYEKAFMELMRARHLPESISPADFEGSVALLCSEATPEKCHRRLVAEMLANEWNRQGHDVSIAHLVLDRRRQPKRRGRKRDGADPL